MRRREIAQIVIERRHCDKYCVAYHRKLIHTASPLIAALLSKVTLCGNQNALIKRPRSCFRNSKNTQHSTQSFANHWHRKLESWRKCQCKYLVIASLIKACKPSLLSGPSFSQNKARKTILRSLRVCTYSLAVRALNLLLKFNRLAGLRLSKSPCIF